MVDFTSNTLNIPTRIQYFGDQEEAFKLRIFAQNQLNELRRQLGFQQLFQGTRKIRDDWGREVVCLITGTFSLIRITVPPGIPPIEKISEIVWTPECFCCCCFAEAEITNSWGVYHDYGPLQFMGSSYPAYCSLSDVLIYYYMGIRYECLICQKYFNGVIQDFIYGKYKFNCSSSDFAEYAIGDRVLVLFRGQWRGSELASGGCIDCRDCIATACQGNRNPLQSSGSGSSHVDGTFVIVPINVEGITDLATDSSDLST